MQSQRITETAVPLPAPWICTTCHQQLGVFENGLLSPWAPAPLIAADGVAVYCQRCHEPSVWDFGAIPADPRMAGVTWGASANDLIAAMEERWEAFRLTKLRERGTIAVGLRFNVFRRDGFRCRYCGVSVDDGAILHADHVIPESKGGPTTIDNLVTACIDCNLGKSDKDLST